MSPVTTETRNEWSTPSGAGAGARRLRDRSQSGPAGRRGAGPLVRAWPLLISRDLALPGVVVGALAHLAQLPAIDLAAIGSEPRGNRRHARGRWPGVSEPCRSSSMASVLAVAFAEPPPREMSTRCPLVSGTGSTRCLADPIVIEGMLGAAPVRRSPVRAGLASDRPAIPSPTNQRWCRLSTARNCVNGNADRGHRDSDAAPHRRLAPLSRCPSGPRTSI